MTLTRIGAALILALTGLSAPVLAQSSLAQSASDLPAPAELPPASFGGNQFVDSTGCVYVRAEIDGAVAWVPRVNRQRQLICNQTPTRFAGVNPVEDPAPAPAVPPAAAPQTPATPVARATVEADAPAPATTTPRRSAKAPSPAPAPTVYRSSKSVNSNRTRTIPRAVRPSAVTMQTRVLPAHIYDVRREAAAVRIPKGYRPAWTDDRLNPHRAEQTLEGIARTRMKWTDTVPRRLIDQQTGEDVTTRVPLVYPYTDVASQQRNLGTVTIVSRDGQIVKQVVRNKRRAAKTDPVPMPQATSGARTYVQAGVYGVSANADAAAQKLAKSGLPTRMGTLKRGGTSYRLVLAGPFETAAEAQLALGKARAAGFSDAYLREIR